MAASVCSGHNFTKLIIRVEMSGDIVTKLDTELFRCLDVSFLPESRGYQSVQ